MYLTSEFEPEDIVRSALLFIYKSMDIEDFKEISKIIFKSGNHYLRDWMGLVIADTENPLFIDVLEYAVAKEFGIELKKDLNDVLKYLYSINE